MNTGVITLATAALALSLTPAATAQEAERGRAATQPGMEQTRNEMLESRVMARLARSQALEHSNIDVKADGRTITLTGSVADQQDIERARRIARRVRGVQEVNANLTVKPYTGQATNISDEELARRVAQQIKNQVFPGDEYELEQQWFSGWEIEAENWELEVEADGSRIILEGEVGRPEHFRRVLQVAREAPGVRSVDSDGLRINVYRWSGYAGFPGQGYGSYVGRLDRY